MTQNTRLLSSHHEHKNAIVTIPLTSIYDKNLNFLFGSGASVGIAPTLQLKIKDDNDSTLTIESLGEMLKGNDEASSLLLMYYYQACVAPILALDYDTGDDEQKDVIAQYMLFLDMLTTVLACRNGRKQCNIFTTNYDHCFIQAIEQLYRKGRFRANLNDGAKGFQQKYLSARNFHSVQYETSSFGSHQREVPQVNLIHLHGSVFWRKKDELTIAVDYSKEKPNIQFCEKTTCLLEEFKKIVEKEGKWDLDSINKEWGLPDPSEFERQYNELPIVNPTKGKFHETVFEEHYYQMLRYLSYELEKENSVLITFGFSFADEHILNIIKRSLGNHSLKIYICCYDDSELESIRAKFPNERAITFVHLPKARLDFAAFNQYVFNKSPREFSSEPTNEKQS